MIRSQYRTVTAVDKAYYLWMLCTIEWMNERQEPISNNNLDRLFSEKIKNTFNTYREIAIDFKDLTPGGIVLTAKGQRIVNSWRRHHERIYAVE